MAADDISSATPGGAHAPKTEVENLEVVAPNNANNLNMTHMTPEHRAAVERRLKRKLDARCALFVAIYIMNYLDRNNIAAARLKGLQADLGLADTQYETCLSILYVGYILMQVPSNMLMNRIARPSLYLGSVMLVWGLISTLTGVVRGFAGMVVVRFCLGFVEAAFLPGALLILSKWYTRRELTTRNAVLFCGNLISNAFSALVAAGVLSNMQGTLGHPAWRWLFWIEGAVTMLIALAALVVLPDLPHNTRGFSDEERYVAQLRMVEDVGEADADAQDQGVAGGLVLAMKDGRVWLMMFTLAAYVLGLSFNAFFVSWRARLSRLVFLGPFCTDTHSPPSPRRWVTATCPPSSSARPRGSSPASSPSSTPGTRTGPARSFGTSPGPSSSASSASSSPCRR